MKVLEDVKVLVKVKFLAKGVDWGASNLNIVILNSCWKVKVLVDVKVLVKAKVLAKGVDWDAHNLNVVILNFRWKDMAD